MDEALSPRGSCPALLRPIPLSSCTFLEAMEGGGGGPPWVTSCADPCYGPPTPPTPPLTTDGAGQAGGGRTAEVEAAAGEEARAAADGSSSAVSSSDYGGRTRQQGAAEKWFMSSHILEIKLIRRSATPTAHMTSTRWRPRETHRHAMEPAPTATRAAAPTAAPTAARAAARPRRLASTSDRRVRQHATSVNVRQRLGAEPSPPWPARPPRPPSAHHGSRETPILRHLYHPPAAWLPQLLPTPSIA